MIKEILIGILFFIGIFLFIFIPVYPYVFWIIYPEDFWVKFKRLWTFLPYILLIFISFIVIIIISTLIFIDYQDRDKNNKKKYNDKINRRINILDSVNTFEWKDLLVEKEAEYIATEVYISYAIAVSNITGDVEQAKYNSKIIYNYVLKVMDEIIKHYNKYYESIDIETIIKIKGKITDDAVNAAVDTVKNIVNSLESKIKSNKYYIGYVISDIIDAIVYDIYTVYVAEIKKIFEDTSLPEPQYPMKYMEYQKKRIDDMYEYIN